MHPRNFLLLRMVPNTKRCRIIGLLLNWYESTTLFFFFFFFFPKATYKNSHQNSHQNSKIISWQQNAVEKFYNAN